MTESTKLIDVIHLFHCTHTKKGCKPNLQQTIDPHNKQKNYYLEGQRIKVTILRTNIKLQPENNNIDLKIISSSNVFFRKRLNWLFIIILNSMTSDACSIITWFNRNNVLRSLIVADDTYTQNIIPGNQRYCCSAMESFKAEHVQYKNNLPQRLNNVQFLGYGSERESCGFQGQDLFWCQSDSSGR